MLILVPEDHRRHRFLIRNLRDRLLNSRIGATNAHPNLTIVDTLLVNATNITHRLLHLLPHQISRRDIQELLQRHRLPRSIAQYLIIKRLMRLLPNHSIIYCTTKEPVHRNGARVILHAQLSVNVHNGWRFVVLQSAFENINSVNESIETAHPNRYTHAIYKFICSHLTFIIFFRYFSPRATM
nr:MAG TPA: hypothetical protein [Caudoviricetes sp.]